MWLIDTTNFQLRNYLSTDPPKYSILSHVWAEDEVTFQDATANRLDASKAGADKLFRFCALSRRLGYSYAWLDTACINKESSAELSEAINSMYSWYARADVCIVYLKDVRFASRITVDLEDQIKKSRWFTRGWTLQELLANPCRRFFDCDWIEIRDEQLSTPILQLCSLASEVDEWVLRDPNPWLTVACIAERMSWAAQRETARPEDRAYSLMGLFDVNMPILYGEGSTKAFYRLQTEIMKSTFDQSLFAWRNHQKQSGLLALSPSDFASTPKMRLMRPASLSTHYMTNAGILIRACLYKTRNPEDDFNGIVNAALACLVEGKDGWMVLSIRLLRAPACPASFVNGETLGGWRRTDCHRWDLIPVARIQNEPSLDGAAIVLENSHVFSLFMAGGAPGGLMAELYGSEEQYMSIIV